MSMEIPRAVEAEKALLGSMLIYNDIIDDVIADLETDEVFSIEQHRLIFRAIVEMSRERNGAIDNLTLKEHLKRKKLLTKAGGVKYINSLIEEETFNAPSYISIIKDKYVLRKLLEISDMIKSKVINSDNTPDEILDFAEKNILNIKIKNTKFELEDISEIAKAIISQVGEILESKKPIMGIPTGFKDLDRLINGFHKGEFVIIAGRPSMGKTAFALNIMANNLRNNIPMAFFSLEMPNRSLVWRMLCIRSGVDASRIRSGIVTRSDYQGIVIAAGELDKAQIFIDDSSSLNEIELRARARRLQKEHDIKIIFIDYLQLMSSSRRYDSKNTEVSEISRSLKSLAKELNIPVVALSQLSRAPMQRQTKEPILSDLRESGAIEQDADVVLFVHRPAFIDKNTEDDKNLAKIIIGKQRNGPVGTVRLVFDGKSTRFADFTDEIIRP
ncbi:replicative DNA helicase [candidate division WOR-3 bacterium]|nr:replicative DNA helicase [candidate division WOR-3 bacterium]